MSNEREGLREAIAEIVADHCIDYQGCSGKHEHASLQIADEILALLTQAQEPVAKVAGYEDGRAQLDWLDGDPLPVGSKLYASPVASAPEIKRHDCDEWAMEGIGCANCNPVARDLRASAPEMWDGPFPEGESWIGVDLDGTLAHYDGWVSEEHIGEPIPMIADMVRALIEAGTNVAIFTARASVPSQREKAIPAIEKWCEEHLGAVLPITYRKDYGMIACFDDRATQVARNDGRPFLHPDARASAPEEEREAWRPIETAPHPGGEDLLVTNNEGCFRVAHRCPTPNDPDKWADASGYIEFELTHWMPIPLAPWERLRATPTEEQREDAYRSDRQDMADAEYGGER